MVQFRQFRPFRHSAATLQAAMPNVSVPEPDEFREVLLHTTPRIVVTTWWSRAAARCGLQEVSWLQPPGTPTTNSISTSKYTILTFLPINLFEQFCRVANSYFLLTAILQLIPGLSPTSWFTTVFPLAVVLAINAIKEGYDDYQRHKSDTETNGRTVLVLMQGGVEQPTAWKDIIEGDIVKVLQDEEVPADLVFLSSSDEKNLGHVETANLDGETNLKLKVAYRQTHGVHTADELLDFEERLAIHCEAPTAKLYIFNGAVVDRTDIAVAHNALNADNLLLRGCTIRKTCWVIGVVVSTGANTKIMMNRLRSPRKVTQLERHMNVLVASMFGFMVLVSMLLAAGDQTFQRLNKGLWYLQYRESWPDLGVGFPGWIIQVLRFLILFNGMIPISLYVTLELVKVLQCMFILNTDLKMYHKETDTPFSCHTTTLNEDLGQVGYIMSDKTGTLTQNVMGFVWASIGGQLYGKPAPGVSPGADSNHPGHVPENTPHTLLLDSMLHSKLGPDFETLMVSPSGRGLANQAMPGARQGGAGSVMNQAADPAVARFFINLAVCNTVVPQVLEDSHFVYQASSPDEEALVQGAAYAGYRLEARSAEKVQVWYHGQVHLYTVLAVLEFNSDRKRMSIICRCPDGKIRLFCKGADTMVMARLRAGQASVGRVRAHLEEMAQTGYRTLCIAEKELTEKAYETWSAIFHAASVALDNREEKMASAAEKIELDLELVGASAVEDKLQDGVVEAIEALVDAGIKVWVLTGDKVETAISIALSCRLFTEDMALVEVRERDFDRALTAAASQGGGVNQGRGDDGDGQAREDPIVFESKVFAQKLEEIESEQIRLEYELTSKVVNTSPLPSASGPSAVKGPGPADSTPGIGLVIEGGALAVALKTEHQDALVRLCTMCKSVVCCRVSPMQKAAVTKLVQRKVKAITLGIGDGANDVGMIQAAHIGCGISGKEGRAAVMASDYSFAQFRYVARLVLIHGRLTYKRNTEVVIFSFYKNFVHNMTQVYFAFVTAWSCQSLYTTGLLATFNMFWTSLPIIAFAFLEKDLSEQTVSQNPFLYSQTLQANRKSFLVSQLKWLGLAIWHSLVIFFLPLYSMEVPDRRGLADDWVRIGCTAYTATIIVVNLKLALRTRYWTWITHLLTWLSIALWFPFVWLYGLVWPVAQIDGTADMNSMAQPLFSSSRFWLAGVLLAPLLSMLLDISILAYRRHLTPDAVQILQEVEYNDSLRRAAMRKLGLGQDTDLEKSSGNADLTSRGADLPTGGRGSAIEMQATAL